MALPGYLGSVSITVGTPLSFAREAMETTDRITYRIKDQQKRYWNDKQPVQIEISTDEGTTWVPLTTGYKIQHVGGLVIFAAQQTPETQIRASGSYLLSRPVLEATSVEISPKGETLDSSVMGTRWKRKLGGQKEAEFKLAAWYVDPTFSQMLVDGRRLILSAYSGANPNQRYEAYGYIKEDSISIAVDDLQSEEISFETDGPVFFFLS